MSHPRRTRGGGPKTFADLCENCEPVMKSGRTSKLSQGTLKSDAASRERKENLGNPLLPFCNFMKNQLSDDRRVLLAITVEIEDGCVEHIQMKEGDSAEEVAKKFCRDHALPEQFVAPLTEHIVSNIINISEDSDIVFQSQEHMSYDENSALRGGAPYSPVLLGSDVVDSVPKPRDYGGQPHVIAEVSALLARREHRSSMSSPLMASQKINRKQSCHTPQYLAFDDRYKPRRKTRRKRGWKKVSDRLIAPTITSLAKTGALDYKEKPSPRPKPLSEAAKAVYMRLYTEYIRHEQLLRDEVKRSKALYQETIERKRMGLSKKSWRLTRMRGKIANQYKNYGELLYAEGLHMRENHLKAVADKKKHDEEKELAELLPTPKISKRAKSIRRGEDKVWSRLQNDVRPKQDQLQELRQEVWESKLMECTFKPRINQNRKYDIQSEQDRAVDYSNRFEQLFLDAESRRRRRAEYMEWYPEGVTFQPCINRGLPHWASMEEDWQLERPVFCRLLENASRLMEKKEMQERLAHRPVDPHTGRELYKPLTGRKPHNRNPVHLPVGEYLYRMKFAFDSKIRTLSARDCKMKRDLAECQYVGPTSQKLLKRLKERGLKQVFDFLDDDKDGFVDLTSANFDRLNNDVVEALTRLMNVESAEGKCKETKLNFEKFVELMLAAERKYYRAQQLHLGLKHKIHAGASICTFQSEMDQLSRNLASKRRKYSTHNEWFKIIIDELAKKQQKVEEWRKEKQEQEMAKCTFKPELNTYSRAKKASEPGDNCAGESIGGTINNIIEKVQQELHGFYFQDERGGPELLGMPASASPTSSPHAMVTKGTSDNSVTTHSTGTRKVCSASYSPAQQDILSELDDLPNANNPLAKSGMFFGLMGA